MKALKLSTEGTLEVVEFVREESYHTIRKAVGGWTECVHLPKWGVDMWVNEEGKLTGLPTNDQATLLWVKQYGPTDIIKGNVIFTGGDDETGETLGLTDDQINALKAEMVDFLRVEFIPLEDL